MRNVGLAALLALALGGCVTNGSIGSVIGSECRITHTPEFAVLGRTNYDQAWINKTIEALVDGCRQFRPKARPASLKTLVVKAPITPKEKSRLRRFLGV